jgi:hypothetical protein
MTFVGCRRPAHGGPAANHCAMRSAAAHDTSGVEPGVEVSPRQREREIGVIRGVTGCPAERAAAHDDAQTAGIAGPAGLRRLDLVPAFGGRLLQPSQHAWSSSSSV